MFGNSLSRLKDDKSPLELHCELLADITVKNQGEKSSPFLKVHNWLIMRRIKLYGKPLPRTAE